MRSDSVVWGGGVPTSGSAEAIPCSRSGSAAPDERPGAEPATAAHRDEGVDAVGPARRPEGGEPLEGRLPDALVALDPVGRAGGLAGLVDVGGVEREDLGGIAVLGPGLGGPILRQLGELVALRPGDPPLLGDPLRTLELG